MAYQNTRFGSSKSYILATAWDNSWINGRQLRVRHCSWRATKVCFPAHVCYLQPFNGHYPNGGRNAMVLAAASNTERFLYWICALVMISLSLQRCVKKSARYKTCWWMPSRIAEFSEHRWVRGLLAWNPPVRCRSMIDGTQATHVGLPNQKFLSIQTFGAMAGGSTGTPTVRGEASVHKTLYIHSVFFF